MAQPNYSAGQHVCCDLAKRLLNDVQVLVKDVEWLEQLQLSHRKLELRHHLLSAQLERKLAELIERKLDGSTGITMQKVTDFVNFIKLVQRNVILRLEQVVQPVKYVSIKDGVPLVPFLEDMSYFILDAKKYQTVFAHQSCWILFTTLSSKLLDDLYPELYMADSFEKSLRYLLGVTPCLGRLIWLIDVYLVSPKYTTAESLVDSIIEGTLTKDSFTNEDTGSRGDSWLGGEWAVPCVEEQSSKLPSLVSLLTSWLMSLLPPRKVPAPPPAPRPSVLNVPYSLDVVVLPTAPASAATRRHRYRRRPVVHPTGYEHPISADLAPIKLHQLFLPPID